MFVSLFFVGVGFLDLEILKSNNVTVAISPGGNKKAVSEWIVAMILHLFRNLTVSINRLDPITDREPTKGLAGKTLVILGKGNIGSRVGKICEAFDMQVSYFTRGDDLIESVKNADIVVDTLSSNPSTAELLNQHFFQSLKRGAYFVTVTSSKIWDVEAMLCALDEGILSGVATDCGSIQVRDTTDPLYIKLANHPKVLATPHIAYNTDVSDREANTMMIDNIEAYLQGKPTNIIT